MPPKTQRDPVLVIIIMTIIIIMIIFTPEVFLKALPTLLPLVIGP